MMRWSPYNEISALIREDTRGYQKAFFSLSLSLLCEKAGRRCPSANQVVCSHQELNQPAPRSWTTQPLKPREIHFCCLSHTVYGIFLTATQTDKGRRSVCGNWDGAFLLMGLYGAKIFLNGDCLIIVSQCIFHPLSELCVGIPSILEQRPKPKNTLKGFMIHFLLSSSPCITLRPCFLSFSTLLILSEPTWSPRGECHLTNPHQVWSLTSSSGLLHLLFLLSQGFLRYSSQLPQIPAPLSPSGKPFLTTLFKSTPSPLPSCPLFLLNFFSCHLSPSDITLLLFRSILHYFIYLLMPAASLQHRSWLIAEVFVFCSRP